MGQDVAGRGKGRGGVIETSRPRSAYTKEPKQRRENKCHVVARVLGDSGGGRSGQEDAETHVHDAHFACLSS